MARIWILALSLAFVLLPECHATTSADGGKFAAGKHQRHVERIDGGDFVRTADGVHPATVEIFGDQGLVIEGGRFRTEQPADLVPGVELARGKSISLYNKSPAGDGGHDLYTEDEVRGIFAGNDPAHIRQAFTSTDAHGVVPHPLDEVAVLAALRGALDVGHARTLVAWRLGSRIGDLVVNGGKFEFHSPNQNILSAEAGKLVWNDGNLWSSGGGGDTVLMGTRGIELLSGALVSDGEAQGKIRPIQYDPRRRLDRDRWTLGKYLTLITDGDIDIGRPGQRGGADLRISDGMLKIASITTGKSDVVKSEIAGTHQRFNLHGGSISLDGRYRSTLLALEPAMGMVTIIDGGTLNVSSARTLVGSPLESVSMWNMRTVLKDGAINLHNAQLLGPDSAIHGGVVNMVGVSAIYSPRGTLTISGGTINVGPQSFIGSIRGDSIMRSPYPSSQHDLVLSGGTLNFRVTPPGSGQLLVVGTHIGGIHAGDNDSSRLNHPALRIGPDVNIHIDTAGLAPGTYTVANFVSVGADEGILEIPEPLQMGDEHYSGTLTTDGQLTLVVR